MKAVVLYVNEERPRASETARQVARIAQERGLRIGLCDGDADALGFAATCTLEDADLMAGYVADVE